jgi:hypothetical protein
VVHHAVQTLRGRRTPTYLAAALTCCALLLGGCGGSGHAKAGGVPPSPYGLGGSVRTNNCTDWKRGTLSQRLGAVVQLRNFAGGPVGSSAGIQNGPVLDDQQAYGILQRYCSHYYARGFKLYKLYTHAAAFVGTVR